MQLSHLIHCLLPFTKFTCLLIIILVHHVTVFAQSRLPQEMLQYAQKKKPLKILLADPGKNMLKIKAYYLYPGVENVSETFEKIESSLQDHREHENVTALHILLTEACRTKKINRHMPSRHAAGMGRLPDDVLDAILGVKNEGLEKKYDIFRFLPNLIEDFQQIPRKNEKGIIYIELVRLVNNLLADSTSRSLPEDLKLQVVEKYIHSIGTPIRTCQPKQAVLIYRNLGVESELENLCARTPKEISDLDELEWIMKFAVECRRGNEAIGFADELLSRFDCKDESIAFVEKLNNIIEAYAAFRPEETLKKFSSLCETHPKLLGTMYKVEAMRGESKNREQLWHKWLAPCIEKLEEYKNVPYKRDEQLVHCFSVAYELETCGDYDAALYMVEGVMKIKDLYDKTVYWDIVHMAIRCLRNLDRLEKASEVCRQYLAHKALPMGIRSTIENELSRIESLRKLKEDNK